MSCPLGAHDNRSVAEVGDRCLSFSGWSRFGASGTDWDKHDAAAHKSPDRRAAQACDKGVPVVRIAANVVLRAATSSFKLGSIQPKAFRVTNSQALTGKRASGSGWVGAHRRMRGYEGGSLGPANWATWNVRSCGGAAALPAERRRGSSRGENPAKRPHAGEAGAAKNRVIALRTRGRETPTQNKTKPTVHGDAGC